MKPGLPNRPGKIRKPATQKGREVKPSVCLKKIENFSCLLGRFSLKSQPRLFSARSTRTSLGAKLVQLDRNCERNKHIFQDRHGRPFSKTRIESHFLPPGRKSPLHQAAIATGS